jgi:hypothetical protein
MGSLDHCESALECRELVSYVGCQLVAFGIERHCVADVGLTGRNVLHVHHRVELRAPSRDEWSPSQGWVPVVIVRQDRAISSGMDGDGFSRRRSPTHFWLWALSAR